MVQVVKKVSMRFFVIIASFLFLQGCYHTQGKIYIDSKVYRDVKSHDVLNAAKQVFKVDKDNSFVIDTYRYELNVTRPKAVSTHLVGIDLFTEFYNFKVVDENDTSVNIELHIGINEDLKQTRYQNIAEDDEVYSIFWNRIDYVLNKVQHLDVCSNTGSIDGLYKVSLNTAFLCTINKDKLRKE